MHSPRIPQEAARGLAYTGPGPPAQRIKIVPAYG